MKIHTDKKTVDLFLGSDFHIEAFVGEKLFNPANIIPAIKKNKNHFNICLLAGDICVLKKMSRNKEFMVEFCRQFDLVYYVEGNHENYNGILNHGFKKFKSYCSDIENLVFLQRESVNLQVNDLGFKIIGATLWGDLTNADASMLYFATRTQRDAVAGHYYMTDFSKIRSAGDNSSFPKLSLNAYMMENKRDREFIRSELNSLCKCDINILMTHHAPLLASVDATDPYSAFEYTDLTSEIAASSLDVSVFGHIHGGHGAISDSGSTSFKVGGCECFSNTAGYYELGDMDSDYVLEPISTFPL